MKKRLIIAIDGPSGVGKSTVSTLISQKLGIVKLESGALYRALAYKALKLHVNYEDKRKFLDFLKTTQIEIKFKNHQTRVFLDGVDVSLKLRSEDVGNCASQISKLHVVRKYLLGVQQNVGKSCDVVAEGRDMGTVVFPKAAYKFYLDAHPNVRAQRRHDELKEKGSEPHFDDIAKDLEKRDFEDRTRQHSPLKRAHDAVVIDTSEKRVEDVVAEILLRVRS
ncbi:MAG: (d)CMP kinase [Deltaproteobacteria bacterium]|nr:(d)CMP kinase [Deltaproteobacteria bacterium]